MSAQRQPCLCLGSWHVYKHQTEPVVIESLFACAGDSGSFCSQWRACPPPRGGAAQDGGGSGVQRDGGQGAELAYLHLPHHPWGGGRPPQLLEARRPAAVCQWSGQLPSFVLCNVAGKWMGGMKGRPAAVHQWNGQLPRFVLCGRKMHGWNVEATSCCLSAELSVSFVSFVLHNVAGTWMVDWKVDKPLSVNGVVS